ncbi:SMI1/KNR4 family protein [Rahnella sikkimica]|uniref:Knr4/Smi1-like domain-containing protein n=1 Tax=Rahnella sikkimica TaxID=1805933 RepID=A0A2L1UXQ6_9GAMM|nr:SMI1/KNR4 family protein [Rahnella sikkimica]AVF37732.1 hypothetical protein BV494_22725 [Rahnella sikkimica]
MLSAKQKLLSICSGDLSSIKGNKDLLPASESPLFAELIDFLEDKNGAYAFESALHIYPYETVEDDIGLAEWNDRALWIDSYDGMADGSIYFAEDIFGNQFCIKDDGIYTFDPEIGEFDKLAGNINEWCGMILKNYNFLTGYSIAHSWQKEKGQIPVGYRLVPKIPFVAGGVYEIENLYLEKSYIAMKTRANLARQIKDVPDGGSIQFNL